MEGSNVCESNHLDEEVRPPPRKRLLAGFKKQNDNEQSASPPSTLTEVDARARVKNLLNSSDGSGNSSLEEIAESLKKAALAAAEVAESARAAAEEKAAVAANAISTAKSALNLVASFYEETSGRDRYSRRNKLKKQVTVHSFYDEVENGSSMNSPTSSYSKARIHKKPKVSPKFPNGKATFDNEGSSRDFSDTLEHEKKSQCLTKWINSHWRVEKDIVTQKRKSRKQLIHMVERPAQADLS